MHIVAEINARKRESGKITKIFNKILIPSSNGDISIVHWRLFQTGYIGCTTKTKYSVLADQHTVHRGGVSRVFTSRDLVVSCVRNFTAKAPSPIQSISHYVSVCDVCYFHPWLATEIALTGDLGSKNISLKLPN